MEADADPCGRGPAKDVKKFSCAVEAGRESWRRDVEDPSLRLPRERGGGEGAARRKIGLNNVIQE